MMTEELIKYLKKPDCLIDKTLGARKFTSVKEISEGRQLQTIGSSGNYPNMGENRIKKL